MAEVTVDEYGRPEPPRDGGEVVTLLGFLDYQRATLEWKCRGLSDEQLRVALPPSPMTLGGLLKHLACVEDSWFTEVVAGEPAVEPWASADFQADPEWTWHSAASDSGEYLRALWTEGVNRSRSVVQAQLSRGEEAALSQMHADWQLPDPVSLRWVPLQPPPRFGGVAMPVPEPGQRLGKPQAGSRPLSVGGRRASGWGVQRLGRRHGR